MNVKNILEILRLNAETDLILGLLPEAVAIKHHMTGGRVCRLIRSIGLSVRIGLIIEDKLAERLISNSLILGIHSQCLVILLQQSCLPQKFVILT